MQAQSEEHYHNEIMALEKLVNLYKVPYYSSDNEIIHVYHCVSDTYLYLWLQDNVEALQKKEDKLVDGAKELQKLLKQSTEGMWHTASNMDLSSEKVKVDCFSNIYAIDLTVTLWSNM